MRHSARRNSGLRNGLITVSILLAVTCIGLMFEMLGLQEINIYTLFILGILLTAVVTASRVCSALSSVSGVLLFNFLFADPRFSIEAYNFGYPLDFIILLGVGLLVSSLAHNSEQLSYRTRILLETDQLFLKASGPEEIVSITAQQLVQLLDRPVVFYLADASGSLSAARHFGGQTSTPLDETAAQWTFHNAEPSGARTARYGRADHQYTCIRTDAHVYGVVGVAAGERPLSELEGHLVQSVISECALTLERDFYNQKRQEAALAVRNEKLRADLLRSISHDLRTPLTSISGSAGLLVDQASRLSEAQKQKLYQDIHEDALWLLGTVENLLAVTRMEEGRMALHLKPELMSEIVGGAMQHLEKYRAMHDLRTEQSDDLLMARADAGLIMQVITNLVDNAVKYTPEGSQIVVRTLRRDGAIVVEVADDGPGIPDESKQKVFEMFYTTAAGGSDARRGMGLGLALCKAIVTAHGGSISVRDNPPHGSVFSFTLLEERIDLS